MKNYVSLVFALLLSACAVPDTTVKTGSPRPTLVIKGAPADSTLLVDGRLMGPTTQFNGDPNVLILEEGLHQIVIKQAGITIHAEKTVISNGESRTVTINAGVK